MNDEKTRSVITSPLDVGNEPRVDPDEGSVGYGRPPRKHQFQKGTSGNPNGRPRGSRNLSSLLDKAISKRVTIKEQGGSRRRVSFAEAITMGLTQRALTSDRAARMVIELAREIEARMESQSQAVKGLDELADEDHAILARYVRRDPARED